MATTPTVDMLVEIMCNAYQKGNLNTAHEARDACLIRILDEIAQQQRHQVEKLDRLGGLVVDLCEMLEEQQTAE